MKAITIWQPWASLLVSGRKLYETRSWPTSYCGPIAIHAAKRPVCQTLDSLAVGRWKEREVILDCFKRLFPAPGELEQLPVGASIGTAVLTRCKLVDWAFLPKLTPLEMALGDFTPGRYAWEFTNIVPVNPPVPASGMQGLWEWKNCTLQEDTQ